MRLGRRNGEVFLAGYFIKIIVEIKRIKRPRIICGVILP
jgi:hypothetical protein